MAAVHAATTTAAAAAATAAAATTAATTTLPTYRSLPKLRVGSIRGDDRGPPPTTTKAAGTAHPSWAYTPSGDPLGRPTTAAATSAFDLKACDKTNYSFSAT